MDIRDAAHAAYRAGYAPVPMPPRAKTPPPKGRTGYDGVDLPESSIDAWPGDANLAIRLPENTVGIDVDVYRLRRMIAEHPERAAELVAVIDEMATLPRTVTLHSNRGDGSGIRLYRTPAAEWSAPEGVDIVRRDWRYAMVPPSVHPEGRSYAIVDERTNAVLDALPDVATLPELPAEWRERLTTHRGPAEHVDVPTPEPVDVVPWDVRMALARNAARDPEADHEERYKAVHALVKACKDAGLTVGQALTVAQSDDLSVAKYGVNLPREVARSWGKPASDERHADARHAGLRGESRSSESPRESGSSSDLGVHAERLTASYSVGSDGENDSPLEQLLRALPVELHQLATHEYVRQFVARVVKEADRPAPTLLPPFVDYSELPDEPVAWVVDGLMQADFAALFVAPAKVGKTTLVVDLMPALVEDRPFLNYFAVNHTGVVGFVSAEMTTRQTRAWIRRRMTVGSVKVLPARGLRVDLRNPVTRASFVEQLRAANVVTLIIDSFAALGGPSGVDNENDNAQVNAFAGMLREVCAEAGVPRLILIHHAGKAAGGSARGASAFEGAYDVIYTLRATKDETTGNYGQRYFKAYGRDVDVPELPWRFDSYTGVCVVGEDGAAVDPDAPAWERAAQRVDKNPGSTSDDIARLMDITPRTARSHLTTAVEKGRLRMIKSGRSNKYYSGETQ